MAEFIMKELCRQAGVGDQFLIDSAAVSTEEIGNDIYPPAKRVLAAHGIPFEHRAARQITRSNYASYDHIVCMDQSNLRWLRHIIGEDTEHKVSLLKQWLHVRLNDPYGKADRMNEVNKEMENISDPWYTGDFETAYQDIFLSCRAMLAHLKR